MYFQSHHVCFFYRRRLDDQCKKLKLENFLLMTYVEKTSYFEGAPPYHIIDNKNIDNLLNIRICYVA